MAKRTYTRRTHSEWQQHIINQQESGLAIGAYCQKHKLATSNFYAWRTKFNGGNSSLSTHSSSLDNHWLPIPTEPSTAPSDAQAMEVTLVLPGGITLTVKRA